MRQPIVFVTDYGRDDSYAASLTGAAWRVDPHALCVDGTHGIPPGDVLAGAYHLKALALAFSEGAVLCAVVDPGVGTDRRAIAIDLGRIRCVAPDNGLISYLWDEAPAFRSAVVLEVPLDASFTFHGRDLFAPVAAVLASGGRLDAAGDPVDDPIVLANAFAERMGTGLTGRVCVVDHFGNAITTIRDVDISGMDVRSVSWQGGACAGLVTTYAEIQQGAAALIGSAGHIEVAARGIPVAAVGGPKLGDTVIVELA